MKTPLKYYGGKQQMAPHIIKMIPDHKIYTEPFLGGGAIFWGKEPSEVEVLNDTNGEIINFYTVLKHNFTSLMHRIEVSLHSRDLHRQAMVIYNNPDMFGIIDRAWAVWVLSAQSYGGGYTNGFGYDRVGGTSKSIRNSREAFNVDYAARLQDVQVECMDALRVIRSRDTVDTFHYCDPPYPETDQGHYDGYSIDDFKALLDCLARIDGKFLLSSFRQDCLDVSIEENEWYSFEVDIQMPINVNNPGSNKRKIEVLTANYPIAKRG